MFMYEIPLIFLLRHCVKIFLLYEKWRNTQDEALIPCLLFKFRRIWKIHGESGVVMLYRLFYATNGLFIALHLYIETYLRKNIFIYIK